MNRTLALAFLAAGVALLILGYHAYSSTASSASLAMTGAPPDQAVWFVIGGLLAAITGIFGLTSDPHHSP